MRTYRKLVCLLLIGTALASCAQRPGGPGGAQQAAADSCAVLGPKSLVGALGVGAAGAGIGAAAGGGKGALIGGLAGLVIGGLVGKGLDQRDCQHAQVALRQMAVAKTGQQIEWNNPATGNHGTLTPVSDSTTNANGQTCRQYKRDQVIGGQATGGDVGVVCRTADGDYQIVQ